MRTTRHSLMAKGILVLLSLLILVFVFTYTWYVDPEQPVEASGLSVSARNVSTDFQYAIGFSNSQTGGDYKHTEFTSTVNTDLNLEELYAWDDSLEEYPFNLLYDYNPTDLTGDGVTLVRPAMNYGNWSINSASRNYSIAEENVQYITFDLIFRTKVRNTTIRLDSDSYAKGACESFSGDAASLRGSGVTRKSKYGDFSEDAIVGAVRVAFLGYADNGETADDIVNDKQTTYQSAPKLVWIPRPDLYLNNNPTGSSLREKQVDGWDLDCAVASGTTKNLVSDSYTNAAYSTYVHQYYKVLKVTGQQTPAIVTDESAVASVINTSVPANTNQVTFGTQCDLVTLDRVNAADFTDSNPDNDYYYGKVRVRIWIEGTDSEARRALAGGKFNVSFHITG